MADTTATRVTRKAKDELLRDSQAIIKDPDTARKWLNDNELMLKGENPNATTLMAALFQLCSSKFTLPKDMICGMRAIALCMEETIQSKYTTDALDTVREQVEDIVKEAKDSIEDLVGEMRSAMRDTEERMKKQSGDTNKDVEKIIEKAVQSATKPSYAQALLAEHRDDSQTATKDAQIKNNANI